MVAFANQVRDYVPMRYSLLGTDGFGRSDTTNLRRFFEVDRFHIAHAAIAALAAERKMTGKDVTRAIEQYRLDTYKPSPISPRLRSPCQRGSLIRSGLN